MIADQGQTLELSEIIERVRLDRFYLTVVELEELEVLEVLERVGVHQLNGILVHAENLQVLETLVQEDLLGHELKRVLRQVQVD